MTQEGREAGVDRLIDERPGLELMQFPYDEAAVPIVDGFVYRSGGTTASYMVVTDAGRLIVNTGMGFEAPHHKALFDAICPGPTPYIITTQAHVDHVGGVAQFREPGTRYVAQANNPKCQADDARIQDARANSVAIWFGHLGSGAAWLLERHPTCGDGGEALGVDVHAEHAKSSIGEGDGERKPDPPDADDGDVEAHDGRG